MNNFLTHYYLEIAALAMIGGAVLRHLLRRHCERRGLVDRLTMTGNAILLDVIFIVPLPQLASISATILCCACGGCLIFGWFVAD